MAGSENDQASLGHFFNDRRATGENSNESPPNAVDKAARAGNDQAPEMQSGHFWHPQSGGEAEWARARVFFQVGVRAGVKHEGTRVRDGGLPNAGASSRRRRACR